MTLAVDIFTLCFLVVTCTNAHLQLVPLEAILLLVGLIEVNSSCKVIQQSNLVLVPQLAGQEDVLLAVPDHLVRHLLEQDSHPL